MIIERLKEDIEMLEDYLNYLETEKFLNMSNSNTLKAKIRIVKKTLVDFDLIVNDKFWEGEI